MKIRKWTTFVAIMMFLSGVVWAEKGPLNIAIIWNQHQPLYRNPAKGLLHYQASELGGMVSLSLPVARTTGTHTSES